jgi:hypothetical protein
MARAKTPRNGRLEEAMSNLFQAQTNLVQAHVALAQTQAAHQAQLAEHNQRMAEIREEGIRLHAEHVREMAEINRQHLELKRQADERFARIEALLLEHSQILEALPDAVRERMGFPIPERRGPSQCAGNPPQEPHAKAPRRKSKTFAPSRLCVRMEHLPLT